MAQSARQLPRTEAMEGPGIKSTENETIVTMSRVTKEGRTLTYKMNVLQQPERARACGAGAKSSADRRPVDPPPIVELKIYEGEGPESEMRDVTFSINANYFLCASIENAREIAHGRVQQEQRGHTVLAGSPISGMYYLDRPSPAGYFIFTDLSVRHEGWYRLSFNLFEELKDPKDDDRTGDSSAVVGISNGYVTNRLEVKSIPFQVFSAKKFPGLAESTSLSRIVADQGCRVRIRRDVRMRRRDQKPGKDWDGYEDETAEMRSRVSATPEAAGYAGHGFMEPMQRARAGSHVSHQSNAPSRRPSLQDSNQGYQQSGYGTAPQTPHNGYTHSSPYATGPSPTQHYAQAPFMHQQPSMQPPPNYAHHSHQPQPSPVASSASTHNYYNYGPPPPPAAYEASTPSQRLSVDHAPQVPNDPRRASLQYTPTAPTMSRPGYYTPQHHPSYQAQSAQQSNYQQASSYQPSYTHLPSHHSSIGSSEGYHTRLAPAEPIQPPTRTSGAHTPLPPRAFNDKLPPLNTAFNMTSTVKPVETSSPVSSIPTTSYYNSAQTPQDSHKRSYGQVFPDRHLSQPLRQGARPSTLGYGNIPGMYTPAEEDHDALQDPDLDVHDSANMVYRRANGTQRTRKLPPHD